MVMALNLRSIFLTVSYPLRRVGLRFYAKNPLENRSLDTLLGSVGVAGEVEVGGAVRKVARKRSDSSNK